MPDNLTIQLAAQQNYEKFFEEEILVRKMFHYPPYSSMAKISFSGPDPKETSEAGESVRNALLSTLPPEYEVNPLVPSGHAKLKDKFRYQFLVRGPNIYAINRALDQIKQDLKLKSTIYMSIDINPTSTFF